MKVLIILSAVVALSMARPSVLGLHGVGGLGVSHYLGGLGVSPHLGGLGVSPYLGGLGGLGGLNGLNGLGGLGLPLASPISLSVASPLVAPKPVQDTPEVAQARAEHLAAVEKAAAAAAAAPEVPTPAVPAPLVAPQPVQDTPEVAQARAEHLAAVEIAAAAAAAAPEHPSSVLLPGLGGIHGGLAYSSLGSVSLGHLGAPIWARSNNIW